MSNLLDFKNNFPDFGFVLTSLPQNEFDSFWVYSQICLCVATKLGMNDKDEIDQYIQKKKKNGFECIFRFILPPIPILTLPLILFESALVILYKKWQDKSRIFILFFS